MGVNTKTIKRRIKSIGNTKKITKAMEMISAVKMRKAVANVLATRSYANLAWQMLLDVAKKTNVVLHPLLTNRPIKRIGIILVTSNRGMAGGFSSKLLQETDKFIKEVKRQGVITTPQTVIPAKAGIQDGAVIPAKAGILSTDKDSGFRRNDNGVSEVEIILLGKRGRRIYKNFGHTVSAEYEKIDLTTKIEEILPMAKMTIAEYINGKYDKLCVAYTDYVSAIKQIPRVKQLLPLENNTVIPAEAGIHGGDVADSRFRGNDNVVSGIAARPAVARNDSGIEFLFEPEPEEVLNMLIPRLVEMQIYQAILESDASEHSARMVAMRNASDAAEDIIKELNYTFNKARQSAITQEIAEICGGAAALE